MVMDSTNVPNTGSKIKVSLEVGSAVLALQFKPRCRACGKFTVSFELFSMLVPPYFVETHQKSATLGIKSSKEQEMSTFKEYKYR